MRKAFGAFAAFMVAASARGDTYRPADASAASASTRALAPGVSMEIAGARIGWRIDDLPAAFREAVEDGRPIVIVAEGNHGGLLADVLRCPTFNTLAGQAHFALIPLPVLDEASDAGRLLGALHMDPQFTSTIVVLDTRAGPMHETLRVTGYLDEASLVARLAEAGLVANRNPLALDKVALGGYPPRNCAP